MTDKVTTEDRGAVRILRINRPAQRNCVDGETATALGRAIEAFAADARARVLVVTGEAGMGKSAFLDDVVNAGELTELLFDAGFSQVSVSGVFHGARLQEMDARHGGSIIDAQIARAVADAPWPPEEPGPYGVHGPPPRRRR